MTNESEESIITEAAKRVALDIIRLKTGQIDEVSSKLLCPETWKKLMEDYKIVSTEDPIDSNGWQWDFWKDYEDESGVLYTLSGSGWYGGVTLRKKEE